MRLAEKQKKAKKAHTLSYLNFRGKIFYLDQMLDHTYWSFHNSFLKTKYVPSLFGEQNDFIALNTGLKVPNLTWMNTLDSMTPYQTGYQEKVWVVSTPFFADPSFSISRKT